MFETLQELFRGLKRSNNVYNKLDEATSEIQWKLIYQSTRRLCLQVKIWAIPKSAPSLGLAIFYSTPIKKVCRDKITSVRVLDGPCGKRWPSEPSMGCRAAYFRSPSPAWQAQTLPDEAPPIGKIHPFTKMATEPLMGF